MMGPLIVALLLISAAPANVQDQRPDGAKLKADAQKVVSMIKGDKAKTQVYCKINALDEQIDCCNVRFGSKADIALGPRYVRFTPKSGH
jgi:hypothetical protein